MRKDIRDILDVLRKELEFVEKGGYCQQGESWGPQCVFEDSPTCLNYGQRGKPHPCNDCALMQFVPKNRRSENTPCRYIPLDVSGETLDALYRYADQQEIRQAVRDWLLTTIKRLESKREIAQEAGKETS